MTANPRTDKVETVAVELRLDRVLRLDDYIIGSAEDAGGRPVRLVIMLPDDELTRPEASQVPALGPPPLRTAPRQRGAGERACWSRLVFLAACLRAICWPNLRRPSSAFCPKVF